ncbi:MAG: FimV/HubP family polar landmark protein [Halofilum sp. (in: g-proteobacteria)]|nr:FimV/HubP family polar landmark protein [Halofilum sp. (in: g-proteobacteria)]
MPDQGATTVRRLALVPILVSAFLFPSAASALGLGDIELQSALNQRLDAEIPLRGVPADRSEDVIVTLASEQAFQDVGLQRPFSLTKLRFEVRQRAGGEYFVHVTSSEAIVEPFLSFLVEVDWPGGNLLREYTVLLDPPVFTTEKSDDGAGAPEAAGDAGEGGVTAAGAPSEIERPDEDGEAQAAAAAEPETRTEPAQDEVADEVVDEGADEGAASAAAGTARIPPTRRPTPPRRRRRRAPARAARPRSRRAISATRPSSCRSSATRTRPSAGPPSRRPPRAAPSASPRPAGRRPRRRHMPRRRTRASPRAAADGDAPSEYGPVEQGETLWNIAARLKSGDMTIQQMMLALLRYNPEAFDSGNINRLKQGYVLRVPDAAEVRSVSAQQAVARVGEQNALWQEWRRAQGAGDTRRAARAQEQPQADAQAGAAADDGEARLSIVGSDEGGAGSDEETSATSASAQSASEELKLAREQLESAEMEKAELQSRVDELEQTVDKMERLITLRENRLNELQEQLEELRRQDQERAAEQAAAEQAGAQGEEPEDEAAAATGGAAARTAPIRPPTATAGPAARPTTSRASRRPTPPAARRRRRRTRPAAIRAPGSRPSAGRMPPARAPPRRPAGTAGSTGTTVTADAGASGDADAPDGGAQGTSAETRGDDGGVVTMRTEPAEPGWLDTISGMASSVAATVGGMLAGLSAGGAGLFAGPTSPGVLGAAALLVLALVLVLLRRRRDAAEPADAEAESFEALAEADAWPAEEEADLGHMDSGSEVVAEELGGSESRERAAAEADLEEQNLDFGGLADIGDEAPAEEDESPKDDTVAEADVYLAYGLHQQAEDLLRLALKESPERADYHEKLLETLYGAGKRDEFVSVARDFQGLTESPQSRPWQRVVAMGKEIAPDESMFSGAADPGIRADDLHKPKPETTDIELDAGGDSHVDFGFDEEPAGTGGGGGASAAEAEAFDETQMFETGAFDAGETGGRDEPATADAGGDLEFDLGDLEDLGGSGAPAGGPGPGPGRRIGGPEPAADDATAAAGGGGGGRGHDDALEFDLGDLDLGEAPPETPPETPAASEDEDPEGDRRGHGSRRRRSGGHGRRHRARGPRARLRRDAHARRRRGADDAAGPHMGELDAGAATADAGEETAAAPGGGADDEALDLGDIDLGEAGGDAGDETVAAGETPATGAGLDLGELDVGGGADEAGEETTVAGGDAGDDGAFDLSDFDAGPDLGAGDLDAEFADMAGEETTVAGGSAEDTAGGGESEPRFDFDVSGLDEVPAGEDTADSGGDAGPEATQTVAGGSAAGLGQEDDEFDTMLDLAKAYIDMGDAESAGNALEEVIQSGNEAQQREARGLLETVQ